jgi:hypothetical protein
VEDFLQSTRDGNSTSHHELVGRVWSEYEKKLKEEKLKLMREEK